MRSLTTRILRPLTYYHQLSRAKPSYSPILFQLRSMAGDTKQSTLETFAKGSGRPSRAASSKEKDGATSSNTKRPRPDGTDMPPSAKKSKANGGGETHRAFPANKPEPSETTLEDNETLLEKFNDVVAKAKQIKHEKGGVVVYWMRMKDLRLKDNMALAAASETAEKYGKSLVILHILSPGDYKAHDRAPVRIDFVLRNLTLLQEELDTYNIPLAIRTYKKRKTIPQEVINLCKEWNASHLYANHEYEVDELRRDTQLCELAQAEGTISTSFFHDYVLVPPGKVVTKDGKSYSVMSPFHRNWSGVMQADLDKYTYEYPLPKANPDSVRSDKILGELFKDKVPQAVEGFELPDDPNYKETIEKLYVLGTEKAEKVLDNFMNNKSRKLAFAESPLDGNPTEAGKHAESRIGSYSNDRSLPAIDGGSRLSPYLATGILSIRACLRAVLQANKGKLPMTRDTGLGSWTQELCFRDFYQHVMVAWPRVSMGRNFLLKFEDVRWDDDPDGQRLKAWEEGRTGYPFVDAGMRQMRTQGWMHNRVRMVVASFLVKELLINWKEGERIFSKYLIDGDLGSNNAGWQWSASTGTDPQPYFRVFNPTTQSEKFDPDGDYIRYFVPELKNVKGKGIHEPHKHMKISEFKASGYPKPIVEHAKARKKAIARFKNPGTTDDE